MYPFHTLLKAELIGDTLVVLPCADGIGFRYADLQTELNRILRHIDQPEVGDGLYLVVDFGELHYRGTEFLGAVVTLLNHATRRGGRVAWCNASAEMQVFLEDRGVWSLWPYFASRDEALSSRVA